MYVLMIYVVLMVIGDLIDYGIGAVVSKTISDPVSLPVFLACYVFTLWLAWKIAVYIAERYKLTN